MSSRDMDMIEKAYSKWRFSLLRFLKKKMASDTEVEDLVQESFLRWVSSGTTSSVDRPHSFLFKIATNLLYDRSRRHAVRDGVVVSMDDQDDLAVQAQVDSAAMHSHRVDCPEQQLASRQMLALLQQAIDELPARQREVFLLHRVEGFTQDEVAQKLGISRQMVVKHLARAVAYCELRTEYTHVDAK